MVTEKKVATTLYITAENMAYLEEQAKLEGRSKSNFLNVLLDNIREGGCDKKEA